MKKYFYVIIILFVQCQTSATEQMDLSFKPFNRIIYYSYYDLKTSSIPGRSKSPGFVKIAKMLSYDKHSGQIGIYMYNTDREPVNPSFPKYTGDDTWYTHSPYGVIEFWEHNHQREEMPGINIVNIYNDYTILFPFFNKRNTFKIGEVTKMIIKTPFEFGIKDTSAYGKIIASKDDLYTTHAQLCQKIAAIDTLLGYRCARIEYGIKGKCISKYGKELVLNINGTVHFAIDEGFVVSDISKGFQDMAGKGDSKKRVHHWKKFRALGYVPYQGMRND